jgi:hypothetical protein
VNFHGPSLLFANSPANTSCILPLILVITLRSTLSPKTFSSGSDLFFAEADVCETESPLYIYVSSRIWFQFQ